MGTGHRLVERVMPRRGQLGPLAELVRGEVVEPILAWLEGLNQRVTRRGGM